MSTTPLDESFKNIGRTLLEGNELASQLLAYPEWHIIHVDGNGKKGTGGPGMNALQRTWAFNDFASAFVFIQKVSELAETYNHHPRCVIEWGSASVIWWSHDLGGVTTSDLQMAALCDHIRI